MSVENKKIVFSILVALLFAGCAGAGQTHKATTPRVDPLADVTSDMVFRQAQAFAAAGDFTRAEQYYTVALAQGSDSEKVVPLLIDASIQGKRYSIALIHALAELERHPNNVRLRLVVAALHHAIGDKKQAELELRRVLVVDPDSAQAHFGLGTLLWKSNRKEQGRDHLKRYVELEPQGDEFIDATLMLSEKPSPVVSVQVNRP